MRLFWPLGTTAAKRTPSRTIWQKTTAKRSPLWRQQIMGLLDNWELRPRSGRLLELGKRINGSQWDNWDLLQSTAAKWPPFWIGGINKKLRPRSAAFLNIKKSLYWTIGNNYGREATAFINNSFSVFQTATGINKWFVSLFWTTENNYGREAAAFWNINGHFIRQLGTTTAA